MQVNEHLQDRAWLAESLSALDFHDALPAVLDALDRRTLLDGANLAAWEGCRVKWQNGGKLTPADLAGITVDRMLFLKVLCALLAPLIRERHAALGLPASITAETCRGIGRGLFDALTEYPDALVHKLGWTGLYCRAIMFKTGLFVYRLAPISEKLPVWAFRERATGKVAALASDGLAVDDQGLICQDGQPAALVTSLRRTAASITGNLVAPAGRITDRLVTLPLPAWEKVLAPGDLTAEMHIPPGRSMVGADCGASLQQAAEVFEKNLAQHGVRCFTCMSWVLSPDWPELLPESNMAKFMREVYLFPIKAGPTAGINFVFRRAAEELDLRTAPRRSRLQRIMLDKLAKKEPLHAGGMFMLLEDAGKYGTQPYQ